METRTKLVLLGVGAAGVLLLSRKEGDGGFGSANINRDLNALNSDAETRIRQLLSKMASFGMPFQVMETLRSAARQKSLYAQGRTVPGGVITFKSGNPGDESRHQSGNAADLALLPSGWSAEGEAPRGPYDLGVDGNVMMRANVNAAWHILGAQAEKLGLRWGGGPSFGKLNPVTGLAFDPGHVERAGNTGVGAYDLCGCC